MPHKTKTLGLVLLMTSCIGLMLQIYTGSYGDMQVSELSGTNVALFSYMRSGSTLTGTILSANVSKHVFYTFEPLSVFAPYHYFTEDSLCNMRNTYCSNYSTDEVTFQKFEKAKETLYNLYTCNIRRLRHDVKELIFREKKSGLEWISLNQCLVNSESDKDTIICYESIEAVCRKANVRLAKILRMDFRSVSRSMTSIPHSKILVLSRDPRGIINSRIWTKWFPINEKDIKTVINNIESLCKKMEHDFLQYKKPDQQKINGLSQKYNTFFTSFEQISNISSSALLDSFKKSNIDISEIEIDILRKEYRDNLKPYKWVSELDPKIQNDVLKRCSNIFDSHKF